MGAYLSQPVVEKITSDETDDKLRLSYGASSMQGWRVSQEDAHNTILDFDVDTSFYAVYDGHGGHEVATYCSLNLPHFIKKLDVYKKGDLIKALEEGYLDFDKTLTQENVIKALHVIAGNKPKDASSEEDPEEMNELYEEATMSIEELLLRYSNRKKDSFKEENEGHSKETNLEYIMSKIRAQVSDSKSTSDGEKLKDDSDGGKCSKAKDASEDEAAEDSKKDDGELNDTENGDAKSGTPDDSLEKKPSTQEVSQDNVNGSTLQNGDHNGSSATAPIKGKGKGIGKGLSNTIRKPVEKTPEELELERKEAERQAKRKERKESLRKKSGDELYKAMVTKEEDPGDDESDMDDEEDADFDGESDSDGEQVDDDDDEWEDIDEESIEEEEQEEVAAKARNFSMNLKEEPGSDSGCTAVVALLRGNTLYVANAGDSRCVLSRKGRAIPLSADHKPEDEPERSRIERAGGVVTADGRVNGGLNLSRAIGDHAYKQNTSLGPREQMITALPDIQTIELEPGDDFFVLACDGIWNSKTNQQVIDFIRPRLGKAESLSHICNELFDECLAPDTRGDGTGCDNMTAIIVRLDRFRTDEENATSTSSQKRPHPDETAATENSEAGSEDEASHRNKKQRVEDVEGSATASADSTAS